jgi:transposase
MHLFTPEDTKTIMTTPTKAVGYIRVSTKRQNVEDIARKRQAEKLKRFCEDHAIQLLGTYEDEASAVDAFSVDHRPGLRDAADRATREGACLMVPEPTRLFRNEEVAEVWHDTISVPIFSVRERRVLSRQELLDEIRAGQEVAQASRDGTVKALAAKKSAGSILASKADRSAANAASRKARVQRSDSVVSAIAHVLLEDLAYRDLSHRALADLLNRRRVATGWDRAWTPDGVRRQRKLAEARILEWADIEQDDGDHEPFPEVVDAKEPLPKPFSNDDDQTLKDLPTFGMF